MAFIVQVIFPTDKRVNFIKELRGVYGCGLWEARCIAEAGIVCPSYTTLADAAYKIGTAAKLAGIVPEFEVIEREYVRPVEPIYYSNL